MVRTKADAMKKAGGKAPRKHSIARPSPVSSAKKHSKTGGHGKGNPAASRPTPEWQKPITNFFNSEEDKTSKASNGSVNNLDTDDTNPSSSVSSSEMDSNTFEPIAGPSTHDPTAGPSTSSLGSDGESIEKKSESSDKEIPSDTEELHSDDSTED